MILFPCSPRAALRSLLFLLLFTPAAPLLSQPSQLSQKGLQASLTSPDLWQADNVPFSFRYDGQDSAEILTQWHAQAEDSTDARGSFRVYTWEDPATKLQVIAEVRRYPDFPDAIDWVLRFRNAGTADSKILEDILPLDWEFPAAPSDAVIRHSRGSVADKDDFAPRDEHFLPGGHDHLEPYGGRSSDGATLPFFNLQNGPGGFVGAIGWTGNWKADFTYAADGSTIAMTAGMKRTHLLLHPGEEIRTPRIVLLHWNDSAPTEWSWQDAQNTWRRLLFAHYTPQVEGAAMRGPMLFGSGGAEPVAGKIAYVRRVAKANVPLNLYVVDAGWYGDSPGILADPTNFWWRNRGDWYPSPQDYPQGMKPLGDALKAAGFGFSLWVEPETAMPGSRITIDHPSWFLKSDQPANPGVMLLNLGDPAARQGITDMLSRFISGFGMTWYRQDFNISPERYWTLADAPDRVGITEIAHITGLYRMLDDLLAAHPGLVIDNCASGGRRLDLEMMSRSYVQWRTDYGYTDTLAEQAQTQALADWVPENTGLDTYSASRPWEKPGPYTSPRSLYLMRLAYDAGFGVVPGEVENTEWTAWLKQALAEYREVQPFFYADFYPLQPYTLSENAWTAWQWDRPEQGDGLLMLLRRPGSTVSSMTLDLHHLDPEAEYLVEQRATFAPAPAQTMTGAQLMHLQVELPNAPDSALIFYRKAEK